MKRWNAAKYEHTENEKIDTFLSEVVSVCRKHGLSIGHEDSQGAFQVMPFKEEYAEWLMAAADATEDRK